MRRPAEEAALLGMARSTLLDLMTREGLPAHVLPGRGSRRIVLFRHTEVLEWLASRRGRQLRGLVEGTRYARRREACR